MKHDRKAIGPVIAVSMLIVVAVIALVGFQSWYTNYQTVVLSGVEVKSNNLDNELEINSLIGPILYIINNYQDNYTVTQIEANKIDCGIDGYDLRLGINNFSLSSCISQINTDTVKIVVYSSNRLLEKEFYIGNLVSSLSPPITCLYNPPESFHGGTGSLADPFQICDCEQLQNISNYLGANYTLVQNIDCSDTINWNSGSGFTPLSIFTGSFDGASYTISDVFINRPSTNDVGIFGRINNTNSLITSTGIVNANITGNSVVGGFVAYLINGTLSNSYSSGYVSGNWTVGGLVGSSSSLFESIYGNIINSYSSTNVKSINSFVGGLVGYIYSGIINNSYANGNVNGINEVGGLIGYSYSGNVENSYATGNVNGSNDVGGLVGYNYKGSIDNSYASGNVNGSNIVGGLVGMNLGSGSNSIINNSFFTGNVNGSTNVGGLIGRNFDAFSFTTNSYWNNHSGNPPVGIGTDNNAQTTTAIQNNISYFYFQTSPPMDLWSTSIWTWSGSALPTLN
ncbi:MAG: hypothetical protein KC550_02400 [Nanoarchaeota archaeon]|nr:hypothetical protein [Nanoarchaeota archaeon]